MDRLKEAEKKPCCCCGEKGEADLKEVGGQKEKGASYPDNHPALSEEAFGLRRQICHEHICSTPCPPPTEENFLDTPIFCHSKRSEESQPFITGGFVDCPTPSTQEGNLVENCCCGNKGKEITKESFNTLIGASCCGANTNNESKQNSTVGGSCCGHGGASGGGFEGGCCGAPSDKNKGTFWGKYGKYFILGVSLLSLITSFVLSLEKIQHSLPQILHYLDFGFIALILCGFRLVRTAVRKLINGKGFSGKISSALLITMAMTACVVLWILAFSGAVEGDGHGHSYIFAAGEVAFLMYLGGIIEDFTTGKARAGIERLVRLKPTVAKYMIDGKIVEKLLREVKVGDCVIVLPGDMISVDGVIIAGVTTANQSIITGEATPVEKAAGDQVFGGTFNGAGAITVEVTRAEDEMTVSKLKRLVEEAEGQKAPISRLTERAASFIVPSAAILAVLVFLINFAFMGKGNLFGRPLFAPDVMEAVTRGVTMLVVLCPCALALATPVAVAAGLGSAAKNGILIKSGAALEQFGRVNIVAFDKTGTLTESAISVDSVVGRGVSEEYVLRKAAAAESLSGHPLARAIAVRYPLEKAESVTSLAGVGVSAMVGGEEITVTKWTDFDGGTDAEKDTHDNLSQAAVELLSHGKTVVGVRENGILIGIIALSDRLRDGAPAAVATLNRDGIRTVMLTGDNPMSANYMASQAGIEPQDVRASLLPEDKLKEVRRLKSEGKVCMVGDGVNDAPALALSDVSLAMGALGSDAAIETASAALLSSDIKKVPGCLRLGRKVLRTIKINIIISMTINVLAVVLSTIGVLNPMLGALVHNASSVLVALNSALLLGTKYKIRIHII
ncbi:MAG: cation-translocating P-type ATPase [Firmicutes bacterium]|nr:cation-translocating P-type ATPase [Bacillota bacterium]